MLFGLEEIRSCPFCKAHGRLQTIASGNSVGAKSWSDGYTYAPWCLPELLITQCLTCLKTFWIKDANLIAEFDNDIDFHPSIFDLEKIENRLRKYFGIRKSRLQMWKELKYLKQLKKTRICENLPE